MPWLEHRRRRLASSVLRDPGLSPLQINIPTLSLTPANIDLPIDLPAVIDHPAPFHLYPEDVPIVSSTSQQPTLFRPGIDSSPYSNAFIGNSNKVHFSSQPTEIECTQQYLSSNELYRSSNPNVWANAPQASPSLLFYHHPQTQPWANIPGHSLQSGPALNPSLSYGVGPRSFDHSGNVQVHLPEMGSFLHESRLTQQNVSALTSRHREPQITTPLYLTNITEKEIQVTITRGNGSKVNVTAKPTCGTENIYIPHRMAKRLGLKIRPIALPKRRQQLTPNGYEMPTHYTSFHLESEPWDIHRTQVSAMVLKDYPNDRTAICLGMKFLQKAYISKLKTVGTAKHLVSQVFDSRMVNGSGPNNYPAGSAHQPYVNFQDMRRLATAEGLPSSSPTSPAPTNTQSFLQPGTVSHLGGHPYSGYLSFSEPSATTGITAPSSIEGDTPRPQMPLFNMELLELQKSTTINPHILMLDNEEGPPYSEGLFYNIPPQAHLENPTTRPSGQDGTFYGHL
ncbi:hypothetical protein F4821DRAFT_280689 [Hypoxylon rubiginosum]|uniref:Uncharacterized protein n=1 Tax=Hypoxylon rubiginosum TaxID=110542 RepID=A0ACC0DFK7_9PEZI|nr:hypothetical protein F4821DRAFT_280689 [Hypoxylon rubiginosum]